MHASVQVRISITRARHEVVYYSSGQSVCRFVISEPAHLDAI